MQPLLFSRISPYGEAIRISMHSSVLPLSCSQHPPEYTSASLLRQAMHLLTTWTPRWTPEMSDLEQKVATYLKTVTGNPEVDHLESAIQGEIASNAIRYLRLKSLAEAHSMERGGYRVGDMLYSSFDEAFDAELEAAGRELSSNPGENYCEKQPQKETAGRSCK